ALGGFTVLHTEGTREGRRSLLGIAALALLIAVPAIASALFGYIRAQPALFPSVAFASCILIREITVNQAGLLVRLLDVKPLRYLGRISYGFYLFHAFLIFPKPPIPLPPGLLQIVEFALIVGAAALSWRLLESPLARLRARAPDVGALS